SRAFEANNIQGDRRIAVVGAYLTGMAAMWWETRRNTRPHIDSWEDDFHPVTRETVDQYASDIVALFRRVTVGGNQYPEAMKAQIFVQGLRPDLALAVGLFMPGTLQAAIERAKVSELTLARNMTAHNPTPFVNPVASYLQQST
ncbi:9275_t:CDS:2, partial [Racocetra fulgida]